MISIIDIKPNKFSIFGEFEYWEYWSKSVIVDGEIFNKSGYKDAKKHTKDIPINNFTESVLSFDLFNLKYSFLDYCELSKPISREVHCGYILSENYNVMIYQLLYKLKKLDDRIKYIYSDKKLIYIQEIKKIILKNTTIPILLFGYGFNNYLYYDVHISDFMQYATKENVPHYEIYDEAFSLLGVNLKEKLTINNAIKLLNKKTNKYLYI